MHTEKSLTQLKLDLILAKTTKFKDTSNSQMNKSKSHQKVDTESYLDHEPIVSKPKKSKDVRNKHKNK